MQQAGGALVLTNGQGAVNRGSWVGQARQLLQLDGAGLVFNNLGQLALADGLVSGSGTLVNGAAGMLGGGGTVNSRLINAGSMASQRATASARAGPARRARPWLGRSRVDQQPIRTPQLP